MSLKMRHYTNGTEGLTPAELAKKVKEFCTHNLSVHTAVCCDVLKNIGVLLKIYLHMLVSV